MSVLGVLREEYHDLLFRLAKSKYETDNLRRRADAVAAAIADLQCENGSNSGSGEAVGTSAAEPLSDYPPIPDPAVASPLAAETASAAHSAYVPFFSIIDDGSDPPADAETVPAPAFDNLAVPGLTDIAAEIAAEAKRDDPMPSVIDDLAEAAEAVREAIADLPSDPSPPQNRLVHTKPFARTPQRYMLLRKILLEGEDVPRYEFLGRVNALPGPPIGRKNLTNWVAQIRRTLDLPPVPLVASEPEPEPETAEPPSAPEPTQAAPEPEPAYPAPEPVSDAAPQTDATPPDPWSPARKALVIRLHTQGERDQHEITARVNALPGPPVLPDDVGEMAKTLGLIRNQASAPLEPIVTDLDTVRAKAATWGLSVISSADLGRVNEHAARIGHRPFVLER